MNASELLSGLVTAFAMYSSIPMPALQWSPNTLRYSLCFLPFVGIVIALAVFCWFELCAYFALSSLLFSAVMVIIPVAVSGGIHLDGFIDTCDALYSRRDMQRKLEIMKDPHVGAFGVIMCAVLMVLQLGLWGQIYERKILPLSVIFGYMLSRSCVSLCITCFKTAKDTGLAHIFRENSHKNVIKIVMFVYITVIVALISMFSPQVGVAVLIFLCAGLYIFRRFCYREFGGITGDIAGFFIEVFETAVLVLGIFNLR